MSFDIKFTIDICPEQVKPYKVSFEFAFGDMRFKQWLTNYYKDNPLALKISKSFLWKLVNRDLKVSLNFFRIFETEAQMKAYKDFKIGKVRPSQPNDSSDPSMLVFEPRLLFFQVPVPIPYSLDHIIKINFESSNVYCFSTEGEAVQFQEQAKRLLEETLTYRLEEYEKRF